MSMALLEIVGLAEENGACIDATPAQVGVRRLLVLGCRYGSKPIVDPARISRGISPAYTFCEGVPASTRIPITEYRKWQEGGGDPIIRRMLDDPVAIHVRKVLAGWTCGEVLGIDKDPTHLLKDAREITELALTSCSRDVFVVGLAGMVYTALDGGLAALPQVIQYLGQCMGRLDADNPLRGQLYGFKERYDLWQTSREEQMGNVMAPLVSASKRVSLAVIDQARLGPSSRVKRSLDSHGIGYFVMYNSRE